MDNNDPLNIFMKPPRNETPQQAAARQEEEKFQRRRNAEIDEMLRVEKASQKTNQLRILLVGQSESGKSTILKNFQLAYAPRAFRQERATWTRVIYLNICRTINAICSSVSADLETDHHHNHRSAAPNGHVVDHQLTDEHRDIVNRLRPVMDLEVQLQSQVASPADIEFFSNGGGARAEQEFFVRSGTSWRKTWSFKRSSLESPRNSHDNDDGQLANINRDVMIELIRCLPDMLRLWNSHVVQTTISRRKTKLEDSAAYFMGELERIITDGYEPSDEDVVRARLRTVGVQTYPIIHERPPSLTQNVATPSEWLLYDVGGSRSQRAAWVPFFEHMNAIIFLAPINCFNQKLVEDNRTNRLEDSFNLYRSVVSSELLKDVQIILFLNKTDLLERGLKNGLEVKRHVTSYGGRPNEYEAVSHYFKKKFKDMCHQFSHRPRIFYCYLTSAVDIAATGVTLSLVRDGILRTNLEHADII